MFAVKIFVNGFGALVELCDEDLESFVAGLGDLLDEFGGGFGLVVVGVIVGVSVSVLSFFRGRLLVR